MGANRHGKGSKRFVLACAFIVVFIACFGARVYAVNASAFKYPQQLHEMGECVELDGAFAEYSYENTDGYAVKVGSAKLMSQAEYLDAYAAEGGDYEPSTFDTTDADAKTLAVLDVSISNNKSPEEARGYLDSLGWSLLPEDHKELWLRVDNALFDASVPQLEGAFHLSVKPGTSFTVHIPFSVTESNSFPAKADGSHRVELERGAYVLTLTNMPTRHQVRIEL